MYTEREKEEEEMKVKYVFDAFKSFSHFEIFM